MFVTVLPAMRASAIGALFIAFALVQLIRVTHERTVSSGLHDFATIYAGGACLIKHCNPYDTAVLTHVLDVHGFSSQMKWGEQLPIYPPTTLALMTPFEPFMFHAVGRAYYVLMVVSCFTAGFITFVRSPLLASISPLIRGTAFALFLLSPKLANGLYVGNPAVLSIAFLLICCFDVAESTRYLRPVLFALACLLKPQLALPFLVAFLYKRQDGWRAILVTLLLLAAYTTAILVWCNHYPDTSSWLADLRHNLALGTSTSNTMNPSERVRLLDPLLNLEYMIGYWVHSSELRLQVTASIIVAVVAAFVAGLWRLRRRTEDTGFLLVLASVSAFTLLPVYHRGYDSALLVFVLPWVAAALHTRTLRTWGIVTLTLFCIPYIGWLTHISRIRELNRIERPLSVPDFVIHRIDSIAIFCLSLFLITCLFRYQTRVSAMFVVSQRHADVT